MKRNLLLITPFLFGTIIFGLLVLWGMQIDPDLDNPNHFWRGCLFITGGWVFVVGLLVSLGMWAAFVDHAIKHNCCRD